MAENDIDTIDVLMDSIDAGEKRIPQVDWTDFCITCVQIYAHFDGAVRIGIAMHQYLCRLHIIDYRIDILNIILQHQSLYTKDIPLTENGTKIFQQECLNLIYFYQLLRTLTISNHTVYEYLKQYRSEEIYFSYEFTALLKFMTPDIFFTFVQAAYPAVKPDENPLIVNILMDLNNYHEKLITEDIIVCSKALFIADNFRLFSIDNFDSREIPSSIYTDFHSFPRKKRNACFDIYWKLRQQYILEELSEDNELLLDPTEEDAFNKMVEDERRSVQNYELMLELPEFAEKEGARAADVLQMGKYFLEYVKVMHCKDEQPETIRKRDNTKGQSFLDILQCPKVERQRVVSRLHELLDGKGGMQVALVLAAAKYKYHYLLAIPREKQYVAEFNLKGTWRAVTSYLKSRTTSDGEFTENIDHIEI